MVIARLGILMEFHIFMNVIKETYIDIYFMQYVL